MRYSRRVIRPVVREQAKVAVYAEAAPAPYPVEWLAVGFVLLGLGALATSYLH